MDQILKKYGLTPDTAQRFVALSPALNRQEIADRLDVSGDTVFRYKRAFKQMSEAERLRVVAVLSQDRFAEVVDDE